MARRARWLTWPEGLLRGGVVLVVAVAAIAVVSRYPAALRDLGHEASRNSSLSYADREIAGGNKLVVDQIAVYAARSLIPEDETYHVAVNPRHKWGNALTVRFVESYYQYFLMPRRPAPTAPWVICYACDLAQYEARVTVLWKGDERISIVRVG